MVKKQNKTDIPERVSVRNKYPIEKAVEKYLNIKENVEIDGMEFKDMFKVEVVENIPDMYPRLKITIPVNKNMDFLTETLKTFLNLLLTKK